MASPLARRVLGVFLASGLLAPVARADQPPLNQASAATGAETEELITEMAAGCAADDDETVGSTDQRKVAWRCRTGDKWTVFVNGVPQGETFDDVRSLVFSPDGQHLAFTARRDKRWIIVEDGKQRHGDYGEIRGLSYSADGRRLAFAAKPAKKWVLVVDGEAQPGEFDALAYWTFSPDGRRIAYVGRRGQKYAVAVDGKEGTPADVVGGVAFSADSRRVAYATADVKRGFGKQRAVGSVTIDGVAGPAVEGGQVGSLLNTMAGATVEIVTGYHRQFWVETHGVSVPVFSADGSRIAHAKRTGKDGAVVVIDGEPGSALASIVAGPVFSPDARHVAVVVALKEKKTLLVDGVDTGRGPAAETDFITALTFAADNKRVAYIGVRGGSFWDAGYTARARRRVYVDELIGREYDVPFVGRLVLSSDARHVAYVVGGVSEASGTAAFIVVNEREGKHYNDILGMVRFEDDGRGVSYVAQAGRKFYAVRAAIPDAAPR